MIKSTASAASLKTKSGGASPEGLHCQILAVDPFGGGFSFWRWIYQVLASRAICFFEAISAGVSEAAIRYLVMPVLKMLFAGNLYKRNYKEFCWSHLQALVCQQRVQQCADPLT